MFLSSVFEIVIFVTFLNQVMCEMFVNLLAVPIGHVNGLYKLVGCFWLRCTFLKGGLA